MKETMSAAQQSIPLLFGEYSLGLIAYRVQMKNLIPFLWNKSHPAAIKFLINCISVHRRFYKERWK